MYIMAYSDKEKKNIIDIVCREIANGKSLRSAIAMPNMPNRQTFHNWINENKSFLDQYTRSQTDRAEAIFEDILKIADNTDNDVTETEDGVRVNHDVIQRDRLRVDSRKWFLSKLAPKLYGDRLNLASDDGTMTPQSTVVTTLTPEQLKEALNK